MRPRGCPSINYANGNIFAFELLQQLPVDIMHICEEYTSILMKIRAKLWHRKRHFNKLRICKQLINNLNVFYSTDGRECIF